MIRLTTLVLLGGLTLPGPVQSDDEMAPFDQPVAQTEDGSGSEETAESDTVESVDAIVDRVQAFYDGIESYHSDFEQTYSNIALGENQESSGHVYFLKPGRMRWDYASPQEKYLISDGEVLWIFEPEFNQAARLELAASDLPTAIRFLMGEGNLRADFEISLVECDHEAAYCLELIPKVSEGQYRSLLFVVDAEEYRVRETTVVDPVGSQNRFVFSNASTTDPLPADNFSFTPQPGMRILTP